MMEALPPLLGDRVPKLARFMDSLIFILLLLQLPAVAIWLSRLASGPTRKPPLTPKTLLGDRLGAVGVMVPTLNEVHRLTPCLTGLTRQAHEVRSIVVVDSRSQDGTQELVQSFAERDPRVRLLEDDPLPTNWVGRPWALHNGYRYFCAEDCAEDLDSEAMESSQEKPRLAPVEWILGIDADTQPQPGLVASLLAEAETEGYDLVSLSPRFILKYPGELLLQPALLMTLLYRFGPTGSPSPSPERVMANGQCLLVRRSVLQAIDGYDCARRSFCDDVTLAREVARRGYRVAFWDGCQLLKVRMYDGAAETWREWGRSLDLKDASSWGQTWSDVWLLWMLQGLPLPLLLGSGFVSLPATPLTAVLLGVNGLLLLIRVALGWAIASSYDRTQAQGAWLFWLSPLADPLAALRISLSALHRPTHWRGRVYSQNWSE